MPWHNTHGEDDLAAERVRQVREGNALVQHHGRLRFPNEKALLEPAIDCTLCTEPIDHGQGVLQIGLLRREDEESTAVEDRNKQAVGPGSNRDVHLLVVAELIELAQEFSIVEELAQLDNAGRGDQLGPGRRDDEIEPVEGGGIGVIQGEDLILRSS